MERNQTEIMAALNTLREDIRRSSQDTADVVTLNQAADRLLLGYQNGTFDDQAVRAGIAEIRSTLASKAVMPLRPTIQSQRDEVLNRNYKALAERMLDQERGTWDSRHLEIVQGAIAHLANSNVQDALETARSLQNRMSDSVWLGNIELANSVSEIEQESQALQSDLLNEIAQRQKALEPEMRDVQGFEHTLAQNAESVKASIEQAKLQTIRANMKTELDALKVSKEYVQQLSRKVEQARRENAQREEVKRAEASIREASQNLIAQENARLIRAFKAAVAASNLSQDPEAAAILANATGHINETSGRSLSDRAHDAMDALKSHAADNDAVRQSISEMERIRLRAGMLEALSNENSSSAPEVTAEAQLLDARMMYEQKRMQFETTREYQPAASDLLKALDFEVPTPVFEAAAPSQAYINAQNNVQRIRQLMQSASSGDVGFYAPTAGSEHAKNAQRALQIADQTTPNATAIPTIQSETAKRSNRLMHDIKQLAYMPSVRADMGFAVQRAQLDEASAQPLFKRVRFNKDDAKTSALLPSIYRVAGVKLKKNDGTPLRKAYSDLNLRDANLELVKLIENEFGNSTSGRQSDKVSNVANEPNQKVRNTDNPRERVADIVSDWVDSRRDTRRLSSAPKDLVQTGRLSQGSISASLKSEGNPLPKSVQDKLSPFLGFDLSTIKVYSGPIAAMASEAMGAHAFTLGKSIFLGQNKLDYSTPEGLGLLAHEILHTSHFNSGDSVESKEQAAETMEARVKQAFGTGSNMSLALEKDASGKAASKNVMQNATGQAKKDTVGSRPTYDVDYIFDTICEKVVELMHESIEREKVRYGET